MHFFITCIILPIVIANSICINEHIQGRSVIAVLLSKYPALVGIEHIKFRKASVIIFIAFYDSFGHKCKRVKPYRLPVHKYIFHANRGVLDLYTTPRKFFLIFLSPLHLQNLYFP